MLLVSPGSLRSCRKRKVRYADELGYAAIRGRDAADRAAEAHAGFECTQHGEVRAERTGYKHRRLGKLLQAASIYVAYMMDVGSVCGPAGRGGLACVQVYCRARRAMEARALE